ncbi:hypothetical protein G7Z17_g2942 [Cylindrodendrum hubeiense]|uniref:Uncharacterized protein n=1 Tax=Cylindrodendrum hubeiense TaxID=595255 RepID=A0A9P5HHS1_9HYPO|nr:hypothetical protein G7Z17_g2942 [Cylindrodendrum hubeiense]
MTLQSFGLFPNFPSEIQDLIWDSAVRPATGSHVHSFIITDHHRQNFDLKSAPGFFLKLGAEGRVNAGFKLAVPQDDPNSGPNSSVYLSDRGLWMTCKQSRAAMERRFPKNEWWSEMPGQGHPPRLARAGEYFGQQNVAHTASYVDANAEVQHITIRPDEDLIYFKPLQVRTTNWFHHYAYNDVPLIDYRGYSTASPASSFLGLHVALDYDPLMLESLAEREIDHCSHRPPAFSSTSIIDMLDVFHESAGRTIWFIDQRLRRLDGISAKNTTSKVQSETSSLETSSIGLPSDTQDERRVFYSNDCVFTEVKRTDLSEWVMDEENSNGSVFDFFDLLQQVVGGRLEIEGSDRMRVLACEAAPGAALRPVAKKMGSFECPLCVKEREESMPRRKKHSTDVESDDDGFDWENFSLFD